MLLDGFFEAFNEFAEIIKTKFRDIYKNNVIPIEGFIQMLELIKSQKILVGLASNAIRKKEKMILNELKIYN